MHDDSRGSSVLSLSRSGRLLGLLLALLALGAMLGVSRATAADAPLYAYAGGTNDGSGGTCPEDATPANECTLTAALTDASPGGIVYLETPGTGAGAADYEGNWSLSTGGTTADLPVTLEADPALTAAPVLTPAVAASILSVNAGFYTVNGVTFSGGTGAAFGGAINNGDGGSGATLTVTNSTFENNTATTAGGAIDNSDATLSVADSTFTGNGTVGGANGGAIAAFGTSSIAITGSSFTGNAAAQGGAIFIAADAGTTLTATGSTFTNNVSGDAGAIADGNTTGSGTSPVLTLSTDTFSEAVGGELIGSSGGMSVSDSTFNDGGGTGGSGPVIRTDAGADGVVSNSTFVDADTNLSDPTLYNDGGTLFVLDSTIESASFGVNVIAGSTSLGGDVIDGSCNGTLADEGYNIVSDPSCEGATPGAGDSAALTSAELGPLADHGGPTSTVLLLSGNPALGAVPAATSIAGDGGAFALCPRTADQRGVASISGTACSAGAVEQQDPVVTAPASTTLTGGTAYSGSVTAAGGRAPYTYALTAGALPGGVSLDTATGVISGTPTALGSFPVTVSVTDADSDSGSTSFTLSVSAASPGTPTITNLPGSATVGGSFTATIGGVAGADGGARSLTDASPAVCTVSGLKVTDVGVGSCELTAQVAASGIYAAAGGAQQTFTVAAAVVTPVSPGTPSITNLPASATAGGGFTASVGGIASADGGAVSLRDGTPAVCAVFGLTVGYLTAGTCELTVEVVAADGYTAATGAEQNFTITAVAPSPPKTTETKQSLGDLQFGLTTPVTGLCLAPTHTLAFTLSSAKLKQGVATKLSEVTVYIDRGVKHVSTKREKVNGRFKTVKVTTYLPNVTATKVPLARTLSLKGLASGTHTLAVKITYLQTKTVETRKNGKLVKSTTTVTATKTVFSRTFKIC